MKSKWKLIKHFSPPANKRVLGYGISNHDGRSRQIEYGKINMIDGIYYLTNSGEGLKEVSHWQFPEIPSRNKK